MPARSEAAMAGRKMKVEATVTLEPAASSAKTVIRPR
jgi:hypothetical protein